MAKGRIVSEWKCNECGASWDRVSKTVPRRCPRCLKDGNMRWCGDKQRPQFPRPAKTKRGKR